MKCNATGASLSAFTRGFFLSSSPQTVSVSSFLVPAFAPYKPRTCRRSQQYPFSVSVVARSSIQDSVNEFSSSTTRHSSSHSAPNPSHLVSPKAQQRAQILKTRDEYAFKLDPYLPLELRSKSWLENLAGFQGVRDVSTLPEVLDNARRDLEANLLSHISLEQGRWEALIFLMQKLLTGDRSGSKIPGFYDSMSAHSPWFEQAPPVPEWWAGGQPEDFKVSFDETPSRSLRPMESMIDYHMSNDGIKQYQAAIGDIWECLGENIIHLTRTTPERLHVTMQYIHRILALIHTADVVSPLLYTYAADSVPSDRRKPPYLHAMSSRIMAAISESEWRSVEDDVIQDSALDKITYARKGLEMPGARLNPHVRQLDIGVWLELVLWSCVHAGHFDKASRLLRQLAQFKGSSSWSYLAWHDVKRTASNRAAERNEASQTLSWFTRLYSSIEAYSEEGSLVEMPSRTISREVILATMDGIFASQSTGSSDSARDVIRAYDSLSKDTDQPLEPGLCTNNLLLRTPELEPDVFNSFLIASGKSEKVKTLTSQQKLPGSQNRENIESTAPRLPQHQQMLQNHASTSAISDFFADEPRNVQATSEMYDDNADYSHGYVENLYDPWHTAILLMLVRAIDGKRLKESLVRFHQLQNLVDHRQTTRLDLFNAGELKPSILDLDFTIPAGLQIPNNTLAAFLEMVTDAGLFDLADWLLRSRDPDGTTIPFNADKLEVYQPSLLHYASAVLDFQLIVRVTKWLQTSLSQLSSPLLKSLFECQVVLDRVQGAEDVLSHLCFVHELDVSDREIMVVASRIMTLESDNLDSPARPKLISLLQRMLNSEFISRVPSKGGRYSRYRIINQCCRILNSLPGKISTIASEFMDQKGPMNSKMNISTEAFNVLLATVRNIHGPLRARQFLELWSYPLNRNGIKSDAPTENNDDGSIQSSHNWEPVVNPTIESVRIIVEKRHSNFINKANSRKLQEQLDGPDHSLDRKTARWAVKAYRQLGFSNEDILNSLPKEYRYLLLNGSLVGMAEPQEPN